MFDELWPCLQGKGWRHCVADDLPPFYVSPDLTFLTFKLDVTIFESKETLLRTAFVKYASVDASTAHDDLWDLVWRHLETLNCVSSMYLRDVELYFGMDVEAEDLALNKTMFETKREAILHVLNLHVAEVKQDIQEFLPTPPVDVTPQGVEPAQAQPIAVSRKKRGRPLLRTNVTPCAFKDCTNIAACNKDLCSRHIKAQKEIAPASSVLKRAATTPQTTSRTSKATKASQRDQKMCTHITQGPHRCAVRVKGRSRRQIFKRGETKAVEVIDLLDDSNTDDEASNAGKTKTRKVTRQVAPLGTVSQSATLPRRAKSRPPKGDPASSQPIPTGDTFEAAIKRQNMQNNMSKM
ncbi:hypothetical protein DYB32_005989 [Aphanomyces invadans]|nr:hypothetical protein DYB32_005989 [Aphanomyces invadans]